jgi:hypothetical protein
MVVSTRYAFHTSSSAGASWSAPATDHERVEIRWRLYAMKPRAVALDVIETLASLDAVAAALDDAGVGAAPVERFFTRLLREGFALAASGAYRPFPEVADGALAAIAPGLTPGAGRVPPAGRPSGCPPGARAPGRVQPTGGDAHQRDRGEHRRGARPERPGQSGQPGDERRRGAGLETGGGAVPARR